MFRRQLEFNERFFEDRGLDLRELSIEDRVMWSKDWILHLGRELHEILDETNWKMHQKTVESVVESNVLEEWIDSFKFLMGLAQLWGFGAHEIVREFGRKSSVVEYRYSMERRLESVRSSGVKVVGMDIDGVLNDYPACFLRWIESIGIDCTGGLKVLKEKMGVNRYRELKRAYRESGEKVNQMVKDGARELLTGLRSLGCAVVALSRRPYWRYHRIYADTLEWFDRNGMVVDAILFHPKKHRKITNDFPNLVAMVEDDPNIARKVGAIGVPVALISREFNEDVDASNVKCFSDLRGVFEWIESLLNKKIVSCTIF